MLPTLIHTMMPALSSTPPYSPTFCEATLLPPATLRIKTLKKRFRWVSCAAVLGGLWFGTFLPSVQAQSGVELRQSVVRITTSTQRPDYRNPWNPGSVGGGVGAGFVIDGERILTNAHVVSDSRLLTVQKEGDPTKYVARVEHAAHDCDLAVLKVETPGFFKNTKPLQFGGIPALESQVSVYGYPIGGDRMSVTQGVVSRIDFQTYSHSGVDAHLTIQIDAAINPGNSGGPVMQDGKVVGVAFQGYSGDVAQNVGYMIPTPVALRFLKDIENGRYDRYVDLAVSWFNLINPAHRRALGLEPDGTNGVVVSEVIRNGSGDGHLKEGDVLLSIDGLAIDSDGFVELDGERTQMPEVVERKFKDETVTFEILREGKPLTVSFPLKPIWPYLIQANRYDTEARFLLFGGLVFQPLSRELVETFRLDDLRIRHLYEYFMTDAVFVERPEIVVLTNVLPDPINTYLRDFAPAVVDEINGKKITSLEEAQKALNEPLEYHVIQLLGEGRPIVLENAKVKEAESRIRQRYNITTDSRMGVPLWEL